MVALGGCGVGSGQHKAYFEVVGRSKAGSGFRDPGGEESRYERGCGCARSTAFLLMVLWKVMVLGCKVHVSMCMNLGEDIHTHFRVYRPVQLSIGLRSM